MRPKFKAIDVPKRREKDTLDIIYWSDAVTSLELLEGTESGRGNRILPQTLQEKYDLVDALIFHVQPPAL